MLYILSFLTLRSILLTSKIYLQYSLKTFPTFFQFTSNLKVFPSSLELSLQVKQITTNVYQYIELSFLKQMRWESLSLLKINKYLNLFYNIIQHSLKKILINYSSKICLTVLSFLFLLFRHKSVCREDLSKTFFPKLFSILYLFG